MLRAGGGGGVQFSQYNKDGIHSTDGTIPLRQKAGHSTVTGRKEKRVVVYVDKYIDFVIGI